MSRFKRLLIVLVLTACAPVGGPECPALTPQPVPVKPEPVPDRRAEYYKCGILVGSNVFSQPLPEWCDTIYREME